MRKWFASSRMVALARKRLPSGVAHSCATMFANPGRGTRCFFTLQGDCFGSVGAGESDSSWPATSPGGTGNPRSMRAPVRTRAIRTSPSRRIASAPVLCSTSHCRTTQVLIRVKSSAFAIASGPLAGLGTTATPFSEIPAKPWLLKPRRRGNDNWVVRQRWPTTSPRYPKAYRTSAS